MGLKILMVRLQCQAADTPGTPEKSTGYQRKATIHAGCTPDTSDTPCFSDTRAIVQIRRLGEAVNAPASSEPHGMENLQKPAMPVTANDPAPEPPTDPNAWRELAAAYHLHHFKCSTCIAAGRGAGYGLRCGVGAALWTFYQKT